MSRIGEELANITESIGGTPTGTSDAALEIKRIIKALDPEASTDGGVFENIVKIRELVQDGKGGGVALKSILFSNTTEAEVVIYRCINAEGKYINPDGGDYVAVASGETVTVYYVEPAIGSYWTMYANSTNGIALQATASGITAERTELIITAEAPDGETVTIEPYVDDGGGEL